MRKRFFTVAAVIALSSSILFTSCIGSFSLTNQLLSWNQTLDTKFVNALIFVALWIVPAYEVAIIADALVINSIEFWSGDNPVEAGVVKKVQGENGVYTVETLDNGYRIENEQGAEMNLIYDRESNTWNAVTENDTIKLLKFEEEDNKAIVYMPNGMEQSVELTSNGVLAFQQSVKNSVYMAAK